MKAPEIIDAVSWPQPSAASGDGGDDSGIGLVPGVRLPSPKAGVDVSTYSESALLYIHAKVIVGR